MWGQARSPEPTTLQPLTSSNAFGIRPASYKYLQRILRLVAVAPLHQTASRLSRRPKKLANTSWPHAFSVLCSCQWRNPRVTTRSVVSGS
jgi:hypothetical protein